VASERLAGAKVLLVEDNEINQQVALEILAAAGLKVTVTSNGQEALAAVKRQNFDVVLMDVQMPVMDGYTAARKLGGLKLRVQNKKQDIFPLRHQTFLLLL